MQWVQKSRSQQLRQSSLATLINRQVDRSSQQNQIYQDKSSSKEQSQMSSRIYQYANQSTHQVQANNYDVQQTSQQLKHGLREKDFSKKIPSNIQSDKETLYEALMTYKMNINSLKQENQELRSKNYTLNQALSCENKIQQSTDYDRDDFFQKKYSANQSNGIEQLSIIKNLKKQVKDLQTKVQDHEEEMIKIRRNVKLTKIQEIELELKSYQDECIRLKHMLQQLGTYMQSPSELPFDEQVLVHIQQLKLYEIDIVEKKKIIIQLTNDKDTFRDALQQLELELRKENAEKIKMKNFNRHLEKEVEILKGNDQFLINKQQTNISEQQLKRELERKIIECNQLQLQVTKHHQKLNDGELKYKEQQTEISDQLIQFRREKDNLMTLINKQSIDLSNITEKYEQMLSASRPRGSSIKRSATTQNVNLQNSMTPQPFLESINEVQFDQL